MRTRPSQFALLALALAVCASAPAQLSLDKVGGALGGNTTWNLNGPGLAGQPYIIVWANNEWPASINGVNFDISLANINDSFSIPGFFGTLNGSGQTSVTLPVPADPALDSVLFSFQAAAGLAPTVVSNKIRITPSFAGVFEPALNLPMLPIAGGGTAVAADGELLFVGGSGPLAQRYRSRTEEWEPAGATFGVGLFAQTTGLADGRVLFTGGLDPATGQPTANAAVYDPIAQTTTPVTMSAARAGHGASLMGSSGKVLVTGGFAAFNLADILSFLTGVQGSTEIFDPVTNAFTPGPTLLEPRAFHTSTTLANGHVLIAGGLSIIPFINVPTISATAYRYNPATNSFGFPSTMNGGRFLHSAVALSNGKVLIAGGATFDLTQFLLTLDPTTIVVGTLTDCQVYTQTLIGGSFATVAGMSQGRAGAGLAALPGGGALIAGGMNLGLDIPNAVFTATPIASADRYASNNTITPTGSMAGPRFLPIMATLPDSTVIAVGGGPLTAEIYQP
jgi:hypothetical protein